MLKPSSAHSIISDGLYMRIVSHIKYIYIYSQGPSTTRTFGVVPCSVCANSFAAPFSRPKHGGDSLHSGTSLGERLVPRSVSAEFFPDGGTLPLAEGT